MRAMIFAAGLGTRLQPLTLNKPKALVEIRGKTLLERSISYLKNHGIDDITVNVHHFADQIKSFLKENDNFGISIHLSDETGMLLDTGGGILHAREFLDKNEPVLLLNTDILTNLDLFPLFQFHQESGAMATLVVRQRNTSRYLLFDRNNRLTGWKNIKTGELKISRPEAAEESRELAFSGIHLVSPRIFPLISESGKFSIIDLYLRLAAKEKIMGFQDRESIWMDLGKYEEMEEAERLIRKMEE